ncbi:hypothetical protein C4546_00625 [Candidatus Parcubacteria bacterium]|jgi:hypothetical protein|nr:MAG: hypothetical protein C4546_00625 [Candidatus Parcubacteria bacterium]
MAIDPPPEDVGKVAGRPEKPENQYSKRVLWFVFCIGLSALVLGGIQLKRNLRQPFNLLATRNQAGANSNQPQDQTLLTLQAKDTDKDGVSDYDELYRYGTSPYIADSDSDGASDKDEINKGSDPNCPEGKNCGVISGNSNVNTDLNTNTQTQSSGQVTISQLRQALLAAGVSQTDLDAIDDATLLRQYQQLVAEEQAQNSNSSATANGNISNVNQNTTNTNAAAGLTVEQLQNLTPAEIRTFLKLGGVDEATLNTYDDATLRAVYLQALQETLLNTNANTNINK